MRKPEKRRRYRRIPRESLHDVIILLIAKLLPTGQIIIPKHVPLHRALYAASQKFPGTFDNLLFDTNGSSPISQYLLVLQTGFSVSGIFNSIFINGVGEVYCLNPKTRREILDRYGKSARHFPRGLLTFMRAQLVESN